MESKYFRICADIDLDAVRTNIINIKKGLGSKTKACCVIKADGYGHGACEIAKAIDDLADFYAVATIEEAEELRMYAPEKPIMILGHVHPDDYVRACAGDIRITAYDNDSVINIIEKTLSKEIYAQKVHIKIDTGMSRIGFNPDKTSLEIIKKLYESAPMIEIEGIYTHLYASDSSNKDSANRQLDLFLNFISHLEAEGIYIPIKHCSNSAAAITMPDANLDMVRLGIAQYGLYPSEDVHELKLYPAMSLKSHVIMVKTIPEGATVGYGASFTAKRDTRVATIPAGYADGYPRSLSNRGYVLINGRKAPVIGRVCMDQFMADVTDIPGVIKGDEVILIGSSDDQTVTMEELSALSVRFNYEFACGISKRVPRRYILGGEYI